MYSEFLANSLLCPPCINPKHQNNPVTLEMIIYCYDYSIKVIYIHLTVLLGYIDLFA